MDYQKLNETKVMFDKVVELCEMVERNGWWNSGSSSDIKLRDILAVSVGDFMVYLSAADGQLNNDEVTAYRTITGYGDSADDIIAYIKKYNIYSVDFENQPPAIMVEFNGIERQMVARGAKLTSSALILLVSLFANIGACILTVDGSLTDTEKRDYGLIMNTIATYAKENCLVTE